MKQDEIIDKFILFYSTNEVKQRGEKLYKSGAVKSFDYDNIKDSYIFHVQGSKLYKTQVKGVKKGNISTSCTCPFEWGTICKHSVAALLFIQNNNNRSTYNSKNEFNMQRGINEAVKIEYSQYLSESIIKNYCALNSYNSVINSNAFSIIDIDFSKNRVVFTVEEYNYYHHRYSYEVAFAKKNGVLEVRTTQKSKIKSGKLKTSEIYCLLIIANSETPNFFDIIFDKNRLEAIKKETVKNYGLSIGEFDTYFNFHFDTEKGLSVYKHNDAAGLLSIHEQDSPIVEFIDSLSKNEFNLKLKNKKDLVVGFVLLFEEEDDEYKQHYNYATIVAKPNKTKTRLLSRFDFYNLADKSLVSITPEQNEIIKLLDLFEETEDEQELFSMSKQIFLKLSKQQFVFGFYDFSYISMSKHNLEDVKLSPDFANVIVEVYNDGKFIGTELRIIVNGKTIDKNKIDIDASDSKIISYKGMLYHIASFDEYVLYRDFVYDFKIVKEQKQLFLQKVIKPLSQKYQLSFGDNTFQHSKVELDFKYSQIYISEKGDYIVFQPQVVYDNNVTVLLSSNSNTLYEDEETGEILEYVRNSELEDEFLNTIASLHPDFEEQIFQKYFYLYKDDFVKDLWFYKFFDKLNARNIEIYGLKELKKFKYSPYKGKVFTSVKSGQDWFDVDINMSFGNQNVSLADIKKAIINKQKYIQLKNGSVGIMPEEWFSKLEKYFRNGTISKDKLKISKLRYSIIDELFDNIDDAEIIEELAEKRKRILGFKEINKTKIPKQITAELRHYQKEGVNWINFLDDMKWGGILADDMGLGKTIQILTFIQQQIKTDKTTNLIIVPTTLLFNWRAEIEKFAPKIKAYFHYGVNREKSTKGFEKYHIVFTSYGILLRDIEFLSEYQFNYVILDESQAIKNPASRRFKAANLIKANNRLALTGTPIENSTFDLYAQMSFVNPAMFGGVKNFKDNYSNPIDKDGNEIVASELQKIINPFVLRRTKEQVAQELPAKTEDIIYCEMEPEQRTIYDAYRNEYRNKLLKNVEEQGVAKSKMLVLEALTRLRQICDSPSLIKDVDYNQQAVKTKEILETITYKTANHKILVFSQFVGMLSLIKTELEKHNISYEYLDGKSNTKQRESSVNNFQKNDDLRVFLISLRAGGVGLNLTSADYVYIVDPWWNPAVENQAIDRCYRIGQDKKVFAYRMICKNTIEEKIMVLQSKKKKIASDIIQTDDNIMKTLSVNDIKSLFG